MLSQAIAVILGLSLLIVPACTNTASPATPVTPIPAPSKTPETAPSSPKLATIRLVGTIGPLSIPLAYLVDNNSLSAIADKTTLSTWATPTQLQSIVASGQGDFLALPTNSVAIFYNKGISLQLLDCSIWNILYLVTADTNIKSVTDLNGKRVVVPYQGAIPDAMFRYICQKQGVNPDTDINIIYTPDPVQASQLLLAGQERYVLLSEPSATSVILKGQNSGTNYLRALNMETEWQKATGDKAATPIAGNVVLGALKDRQDIVNTFIVEYKKAEQWMLANPAEAGNLGAKVLAGEGFTAPVLTDSIQNIDWRFVTAPNARPDIESFFKALSQVSPNYIGGKLPDSNFYYGQ